MEGKDVVLVPQSLRHAYSDRLLSDAREPLADPSLSKENEHPFLYHSWQEEGAVEVEQGLVVEPTSVERRHGTMDCIHVAGTRRAPS